MKFFNRVRQFTGTMGVGDTVTLGSSWSDAFLTLVEAGGAENDETVIIVEQGDDFGLYRVTVGASAATVDIDAVLKSKIAGTAGTSRVNLDGSAVVRFCESAEDLNDILARLPNSASDPQFTTIELGHASDTTVSRPAAGRMDIEGEEVITTKDLSTTLTAARQAQVRSNIGAVADGYLWGLTLSNNATDPTNDIDIAVGKASSTETSPILLRLTSGLTKRLDAAWAAGTNQGGLDTGSIANTTYHVWLIRHPDGTVDVLFSTSASAPTLPSGYNRQRRIGSIVRTGGAIKAFVQDGDRFMWSTPVQDVSAANVGTSAVTRTLTVPTGIRVRALILVAFDAILSATDNPIHIYISDLSLPDNAPASAVRSWLGYFATDVAHVAFGGPVETYTNTSGQVRSRLAASTANLTLFMNTNGWVDTRGRDA